MLRNTVIVLLALLTNLTLIAQNPGAGSCIGFNGTSQYVAIPHNNTLNSTTALTLEAWILPNGYSPNTFGNVILGKDGWQFGEQGYTLRCGGNGALSFNIGTSSGWQEVLVSNVLISQSWQHVAATYDGSVMRLYLNGVQIGTRNYSGSIASSTYDLNIGRIPFTSGGPRHFQGELDEIRVWTSVLSPATLRDWMCRKVTSSHPNYASLGGYWRFDDGAGNTLSDLSPNNNNGTLVSGPIWGLSGAAIGDTSLHAYGGTVSLNMPGFTGGNFLLDNVSGTPDGVQLYRVDEPANLANVPTGYTSFDGTYYGTFIVSNTSHTFDVTVGYGGNPYIGPNDGCIAALAGRNANNIAVWYDIAVTRDLAQSEIKRVGIGQQQFILGRQPQPFPLLALGRVDVCAGDTATLATNSGTGLTYAWYRDGILIPGATTAGYAATQPGNYHIQVTDGPCGYSTDTVTVIVYPLPTPTQTPLGGLCINAGVQTLSATPPGGSFSGPGVTGSQFDPLFSGLGSIPVVYSYTDSNMCTGADTQLVNVFPTPSTVFNNPTSVCENDPPFTLSNASPGGGIYSGPGVSANDFYPASVGAGNYPLQYVFTDTNGCTDTSNASITVWANPAAPTISLSGNTFVSSAPTGNQWLLNGNAIPGATATSYQPTATGLYTVIVIDSNGCPSDPSMGMSFVGIEEGLAGWEVWPNPVESTVNVRWAGVPGETFTLQVQDLQGRTVWQQVGNVNRAAKAHRIGMQDLPAGVYFLHLQTDSGRMVQKLVRD